MALTVPPMFENHWNPPAGLSEIDALVYRSNLLASDRAIVNFGGGNTSVKTRERDHTGRETERALGEGIGQRPRDDHGSGLRRPAARRGRAARTARRR